MVSTDSKRKKNGRSPSPVLPRNVSHRLPVGERRESKLMTEHMDGHSIQRYLTHACVFAAMVLPGMPSIAVCQANESLATNASPVEVTLEAGATNATQSGYDTGKVTQFGGTNSVGAQLQQDDTFQEPLRHPGRWTPCLVRRQVGGLATGGPCASPAKANLHR